MAVLLVTAFLSMIPALSLAEEACTSVVTLTPALGQMVFQILSDQDSKQKLLGVSAYSPLPLALKAKEVASMGRVDFEKVLSLHASCVLFSEGVLPAPQIDRLRQLLRAQKKGAALISVPLERLSDIARAYRRIGKIFERTERGETLALDVEKGLRSITERFRAAQSSKSIRVFFQLDEAPLVTLGGQATFLSEVFRQMGIESVFQSIPEAYPRVSWESVVQSDPDEIWILEESSDIGQVSKKMLEWRERFPELRAVKNRKLRVVASAELTLPTNSVLLGLERILAKP